MKRVAVFNDTSTSNHYGCFSVMNTITNSLKEKGLEPAFFWPVAQDWRPFKESIKAAKFDLVLINGEGSIHSSASRPRAKYLCELAGFSRHELKVPSVLINASIFNIEDSVFSAIKEFDQVWVRENRSVRYLAENGITSEMVPDLSFFSIDPAAQKRDPRCGVMVTDSVLPEVAAALLEISEDISADYVPMDKRTDSEIVKKIKNRLRGYVCKSPARTKLKNNKQFQEFVNELQAATYLITGRFHASTLGITARTPFWAIESNTPKISSVCEDIFGNADRCLPVSEIKARLARMDWMQGFSYSESELRSIDDYLNMGAGRKEEMFQSISRLSKSV